MVSVLRNDFILNDDSIDYFNLKLRVPKSRCDRSAYSPRAYEIFMAIRFEMIILK